MVRKQKKIQSPWRSTVRKKKMSFPTLGRNVKGTARSIWEKSKMKGKSRLWEPDEKGI